MALLYLILISVVVLPFTKASIAIPEIPGGENGATILELTKCCEKGEVYDTDSHQCTKIQEDAMQFKLYDYFMDLVLYMVVLDDGNLLSETALPNEYNITKIGRPNCIPGQAHEHILFNIVDELGEPGNEEFLIDYPHQELFETRQYKHHSDYCVDVSYRYGRYWGISALFCKEELNVTCQNKKCIRFCCPPSYVYNDKYPDHCQPSQDFEELFEVLPKLYDEEKRTNIDYNDKEIEFIYSFPENCSKTVNWTITEDERIAYNKDGNLRIGSGSFNYGNSCIFHVEQSFKESTGSKYSTQIHICDQKDVYQQGYMSWIHLIDFRIIPGILIMASILLGILFAYELINNRDKLFAALRMCVIMMYFIFNLVLCVVKLQGDKIVDTLPHLCFVEAILIQFSYLCTICWLNVMCFDVWSKFRRISLDSESNRRGQRLRNAKTGFRNPKFKWYALYALGIPFIVSCVTVVMHFLPEDATANMILPFRGISEGLDSKRKCFFDNNLSTLLYFFVVTGPILLSNLLLFILFTWSLCCGVWSHSGGDVTLSRQRNNFKRVSIMFFTLGLPWIFDLITFVLMWLYEDNNMDVYFIKTALNILSASQGIIMFCAIFLSDSRIRRVFGCYERATSKSIQMSIRKSATKNSLEKQTKAMPV